MPSALTTWVSYCVRMTSAPLPPDELGPRIAEIYAVVGPLYRRVHRTVEQAEHIEGASVGVRAVLDMLRAGGPMTVPQMGREQALSRQFVQRMVNDALDRAWLRTLPNPAHKRSSRYELTAAGRRTITAIVRRENALMRRIGGGLTAADTDTCLRVLRQMLALLDPLEPDADSGGAS